MNIPFFIVSSSAFITASIYAYHSWFQPTRLTKASRDHRRKALKIMSIKGNPLTFFDQTPGIEVWFIRIASLVGMALSLLGIVVAIRGPFVVY